MTFVPTGVNRMNYFISRRNAIICCGFTIGHHTTIFMDLIMLFIHVFYIDGVINTRGLIPCSRKKEATSQPIIMNQGPARRSVRATILLLYSCFFLLFVLSAPLTTSKAFFIRPAASETCFALVDATMTKKKKTT